MKTKTKIAALSGGLLIGLATLVPLTSYATDVNITATVNAAITLDTASGFTVSGNAGAVMDTGRITAIVKANTKYNIGLKTATAETAMKATGINDSIPAGTNVTANTSAWGIKAKTGPGDNDNATTYTKITASNQNLFTSTGKSADTGDTIKFAVGISTSPNITAGDYSISLTVTASAAS